MHPEKIPVLPRRFVTVPVPAVDEERVAPAQGMGVSLVGQPPLSALGVGKQQLRHPIPDHPVGANRVKMAEIFQADQRPFRRAGEGADRDRGELSRFAVFVEHSRPPFPCDRSAFIVPFRRQIARAFFCSFMADLPPASCGALCHTEDKANGKACKNMAEIQPILEK